MDILMHTITKYLLSHTFFGNGHIFEVKMSKRGINCV